MAVDNAKVRRWIASLIVLAIVIGAAGWFAYRMISESRREVARQQQDERMLRMLRYQDALREIDQIGDDGDEATRNRCRKAIELLALLEPDWYSTYRVVHPAPEWLSRPPTAKP